MSFGREIANEAAKGLFKPVLIIFILGVSAGLVIGFLKWGLT